MVAAAQGLLHLFLARGVDALADDAHMARAQARDLLGTCDAEPVAHGALPRLAPGKKRPLPRRVLGRGAAAAAHDGHARVEQARDGAAVLGSVDIEHGAAVLDARKAGVGLDHDGALGPRQHALDERNEVVGAERAVDAHGVGAHRAQGDGRDLGRGAEEGAAVLGERHRDEDGQVGVLDDGKKRRLGLREVGHGLDDEEVGARGGRGPRLLGKERVRLVEGKGPHGLEKLARRADVGGDVACPRGAGARDGGVEDLLHRRGVAELVAVRAEGVRGNDVRAGGDIGGVHLGDLAGVGEAQKLRQLAGGKAARLQLRAHGAVEDEEVLSVENTLQIVVGHAQAPRLQADLGPGAVELLCVCHVLLPTLVSGQPC